MTTGAEKRPLRNTYVVLDRHRRKVEKPTIFAKPNMIAQTQSPRERDAHVGLDDYPRTDRRAEALEDKTFHCREFERAKTEQHQTRDHPERLCQNRSAANQCVRFVGGKVDLLKAHVINKRSVRFR